MDLGLTDKIVVITGGSGGIGKAAAITFLNEGATVIITDVNIEMLNNSVQELRQYGRCEALEMDVTNYEEIQNVFNEIVKRYGSIDILLNNAGLLRPALIEETDEKLWDLMHNINLKGVFLCSKAVLKHMKLTGGTILNAASFAAKIPAVTNGAYAAAKAGVISLTQICAAEFAPYEIRVLAYMPGVISTALTQQMRENPEIVESQLSSIALNRFGEASDVGNVLVLLASTQASYMTGSVVEVHGGKLCVQNADAVR